MTHVEKSLTHIAIDRNSVLYGLDVNTGRTFDSGRFRKFKTRRKGGKVRTLWQDQMTGHLYATEQGARA
jgi:hypothetical protein